MQTSPFYKLPKLLHIPIAMSMHMPNWWTHYNTEHSIIPTAIAISTLPNVTSIVCGMISKPCSFLNHANAIHIGIHEATELAQIKSSPSFKLTANSICLNNSSVHQRATGMASLRYNMVSLKTGGAHNPPVRPSFKERKCPERASNPHTSAYAGQKRSPVRHRAVSQIFI